MKPLLSIIIVHWNTPKKLKKLLQNLSNSSKLQIIIIDNNSVDRMDWIPASSPAVKLIENKSNLGYARACNQGVLEAKADWLLFLNPDVFINFNQIKNMISEAKERGLDAVSPTRSSDYSKPLPTPASIIKEFTPLGKIIPSFIFKKTTLVGGILLIKKQVLIDLGGWDERFHLWFEDSDLTKRLADSQYKTGTTGQEIKHIGGSSLTKLDKQQQKDIFFHSMKVYAHKHFGFLGKNIVNILTSRYTNRNTLPPQSNTISITVPNLKKTLLDLFLKTNLKHFKGNQELIIVTSALTVKQLWQYREKYQNIRFIHLQKNHGFAQTVNIGLRISRGEWIGTINDDVSLKSNSLNTLKKSSKQSDGSINPVIMNQDKIESAGINILPIGKAVPITSISKDTHVRVDATNAACVLYRNQALNQVGLFDEKIESYLEDIDLSIRLKSKGWQNSAINSVKIQHLKHTSGIKGTKKAWLDTKNWWLIIFKHWRPNGPFHNLFHILLERFRNINGLFKSFSNS